MVTCVGSVHIPELELKPSYASFLISLCVFKPEYLQTGRERHQYRIVPNKVLSRYSSTFGLDTSPNFLNILPALPFNYSLNMMWVY
jgi:hypothetical protein